LTTLLTGPVLPALLLTTLAGFIMATLLIALILLAALLSQIGVANTPAARSRHPYQF